MPRTANARRGRICGDATGVGYRQVPLGVPGNGTSRARAGEQPLVTMWVGVRAIVVAISMPGVEPDTLQISVRGSCLKLRGAARSHLISQDIVLPWAVEPNPVRIDDGSGVFHVLLQRKETGFLRDRGSLDSAILKSVRLYFATDGRSGARRSDGASLILKSLEGYFGRERHAKGDAADPG